ncbi:MAG TPA: cation diffusion facilitator family transporter [bacterium]|nr:cation diffusion facilitator family transporter [bacterium]HNT65092.1 cation diffusion facilitator family transporter [bacterium]
MATRLQKAQQVTWIGFLVNFLLVISKLFAGFVGKSAAMIADGVHSLSDFITDIIVLVFMRVSDKGSDSDHRYGHGKYETFSTLLISTFLLAVGIGICWRGIQTIAESLAGRQLGQPSIVALLAAFVSILAKEGLYRYTARVGESIKSQAVLANAWHHRSDALSSVGTFLGISGAIFLGSNWRLLDPLASVVVSFFIMKVAIQLGKPTVQELLESALPETVEKDILQLVHQTPGVRSSHKLKTRRVGNVYAIDIHVQLDRDISLVKSHDIASEIEKRLRDRYGPDTHIGIHTEPIHEEGTDKQ